MNKSDMEKIASERMITKMNTVSRGMFGNASARVVIEEYLSGIECSVFVLTDGKEVPLPRGAYEAINRAIIEMN